MSKDVSICWVCKGKVYHKQPYGKNGRVDENGKISLYMLVDADNPKLCVLCIFKNPGFFELLQRIHRSKGADICKQAYDLIMETSRKDIKKGRKLFNDIDHGKIKEFNYFE